MVTLTTEQIAHAEAALAGVRNGAPRAMARAINRAVRAARAEAVRQARASYNVQAGAVRGTLRLVTAKPNQLWAQVVSTGKRIPLIDFGPRPSQPGTGGPGKSPLAVATSREEGRSPVAGAFIAQPGGVGGHVGVYERHGESREMVRRSTGKKRKAQPIRELYGPAVPQMLGRADIAQEIEAKAQATLAARLDHEIARMLEAQA